MCFDIDVDKLSLEELRDALRRISHILSRPTVVANLPDLGHQLRLVKLKLEKEIKFRESLEKTHEQMKKLSIRCASETNLASLHESRLCSIEKSSDNVRPKFKPYKTLKSPSSCKVQSMKELRNIKLLDLPTSLSLQKQQDDRVKVSAEQIKMKREKLAAMLNIKLTDDSSESGADFSLRDIYLNDSDLQTEDDDFETDDTEPPETKDDEEEGAVGGLAQKVSFKKGRVSELDKPGTSGVQFVKARIIKPADDAPEAAKPADNAQEAAKPADNAQEAAKLAEPIEKPNEQGEEPGNSANPEEEGQA